MLQASSSLAQPRKTLSVGALFAGKVNDQGFMQAGWRGLERARMDLGIRTQFIDSVAPQKELLSQSLAHLAQSGVDLVIAHGGQNNEACKDIATQYPRVKFAVTQGAVMGSNLASFEILQEQSAYLAGVLAALSTRTGVVGHMSGIRVRPGLKGRAAFAQGVKATNPQIKLLTNFSGNQDDNALSQRVAHALMDAQADVVFTMLNSGRQGVIDVCRSRGVRQIGNVSDWVELDPEVFIGSAIADVSMAVFEAIKQAHQGEFVAGRIHKVGLQNKEAVRLSMAKDVPIQTQQTVLQVALALQQGAIEISEIYEGPEFANPL